MVKFLSEQHGNSEKAIQEILFSNHPIFQQLRQVTRTPYRILFYNHSELETWLKCLQKAGTTEGMRSGLGTLNPAGAETICCSNVAERYSTKRGS